MSLNALRRGNHVLIGSARFVILKKLDGDSVGFPSGDEADEFPVALAFSLSMCIIMLDYLRSGLVDIFGYQRTPGENQGRNRSCPHFLRRAVSHQVSY